MKGISLYNPEKLYIREYTSGNLREKKMESGLLCTDSFVYHFGSFLADDN